MEKSRLRGFCRRGDTGASSTPAADSGEIRIERSSRGTRRVQLAELVRAAASKSKYHSCDRTAGGREPALHRRTHYHFARRGSVREQAPAGGIQIERHARAARARL